MEPKPSMATLLKVTGCEAFPLVVRKGATAADAVAAVQQRLQGHPWHGNWLLSAGFAKLAPTAVLDPVLTETVALTLSNYSCLAPEGELRSIPTELRGITIRQLDSLLKFAEDMVAFWCETYGAQRGQTLQLENFNLYHANCWIIEPATKDQGGQGCSYVELVAETATLQCPEWFASHAWIEPVRDFVRCLAKHLVVRDLADKTPYWVCAYANNQHMLDDELSGDPRTTSFYRAMKLCVGILLVLDEEATPFMRIWCCFEESIAVGSSVFYGLERFFKV